MEEEQFLPLKPEQTDGKLNYLFAHLVELEVQKYLQSYPYWQGMRLACSNHKVSLTAYGEITVGEV